MTLDERGSAWSERRKKLNRAMNNVRAYFNCHSLWLLEAMWCWHTLASHWEVKCPTFNPRKNHLTTQKKVCFVFNLSPTMTYLLVICHCIKAIGCNLESRPFTWCLESLNSHVSNTLPGKSDFAAIICRGPDAAPHLTASFWRRHHISPVSGGNHPVWHEWINVVLPYLWTTSAETSNV